MCAGDEGCRALDAAVRGMRRWSCSGGDLPHSSVAAAAATACHVVTWCVARWRITSYVQRGEAAATAPGEKDEEEEGGGPPLELFRSLRMR